MIDELTVYYDPTALALKVDRRRRLVRGRIINLAISVIIVVVLAVWQPAWLGGVGLGVISVVLLAVPVGWLVAYLIGYRQARSALATIGTGVAVRIGRDGVEVAGLLATWPEVAVLEVVKGSIGAAPTLSLTCADGRRSRVRLDQIPVFPATLDTTARAYSGGRHGVDLAALES